MNVASNIREENIVNSDNKVHYKNNIYMASVDSIFKQKALMVFLDRNKIRDMYDLAHLIKNEKYTMQDAMERVKYYRLTYTDSLLVESLANKEEDPMDESLNDLVENPPTYNELKSFFEDEIKKFKMQKIKEIKGVIHDRYSTQS